MNRVRVVSALAASLALGGAWTSARATGEQPSPAASGDQGVNCYVDAHLLDDAQERQRLRTAPHGARRASAHALVVNTKSGTRRFADPKPYLEELDRVHWSYCGYVAALHAHLIGLEDGSVFTGKLLLDRSGRKLDAGAAVYPSPDGKLFLAASQEDGDELEQWVILDMSGRRLWSGKSGITKIENNVEVVLLEFEAPLWIGNDAIRVKATCGDGVGTKGQATLVRDGKSWRWKSEAQCKS